MKIANQVSKKRTRSNMIEIYRDIQWLKRGMSPVQFICQTARVSMS